MASNEREIQRQAAFMCPTCKQPVATELKRHKTLGIFVPVWGPGPCRNPDCADHVVDDAHTEHPTHR
ncbi:hypothetical protein ACIGJO_09855 [Streptomyces sp. NPDC079020]|uniref:hypothetical protein n=1 Tax=Streptomyces sp. NPDC079020 TaxID=3365722 RepID=UPI0037CEB13C